MAIKINVKFGSDVLSESINIQSDMVLGENCVISGFKVSSYTNNTISIAPGVACVRGAKIEETSETRKLTIPNLSHKMWYAVLKYDHPTSDVSFYFKTNATIAINEVILVKVKVLNGAISIIENADSTKMICELNRNANSLQQQIDNLDKNKCDKGHTIDFSLITNKPQYYPVDVNYLKQIFEVKGICKGITCEIDLNAPTYYPNAWHDVKISRAHTGTGCRFNWGDYSVTLEDAGIYIMEVNFTYICQANSNTDSGFDFQILENGAVQDKFRQYYNVYNHYNGCSFIYCGMNTVGANTTIRPQIKPIFDPGKMSTHFSGFWSIRKLCDMGPGSKSMKIPIKKLLGEIDVNQRGDILGLTLGRVFPQYKMDVDYQVQYIDDKKCKIRIYNQEFLDIINNTPTETIIEKSQKVYPKALEVQQEKNKISKKELLNILRENKNTLEEILSQE